jgi:hypothetical protein
MYHPFGLALATLLSAGQATPAPHPAPVPPVGRRLTLAVDQVLAATARRDTPPPRREEPRRGDEPRRDEPRRDEPRREEPRREEPRRDEPRGRYDDSKPRVSPAPRSLGEPQLRRRRPE